MKNAKPDSEMTEFDRGVKQGYEHAREEIRKALGLPVTVKVEDVDPVTMKYLERVTQRSGQEAIDCWMKYVGWIGDQAQHPVSHRVKRAYQLARS